MVKTGRNDPCPCGSGKKFKRCHGYLQAQKLPIPELVKFAEKSRKRFEAQSYQRRIQQGLGREIISTEVNGGRLVAVGDKLLHSSSWDSFTDFLGSYVRMIMGVAWGQAEISKPEEDKHQLIKWYQLIARIQTERNPPVGMVSSMPSVGVMTAYLGLAYNLYCIDHNAKLQATLISRLKNTDNNFYGVLYEIEVAASMIRAGFEVVFEDESDRRTSHCEFSARSKVTGKTFSVECKRLEASTIENHVDLRNVTRNLTGALKKKSDYERFVFIDLNFPFPRQGLETMPSVMDAAIRQLRKLEENRQNGGHLPSAFVFFTNHPCHLQLEDSSIPKAVASEGFKNDALKLFKEYSLDEMLVNRERHPEYLGLLKSIRTHSEIPSTFDGDIPEFAFNPELRKNRLMIGDAYAVPNGKGEEEIGILENAVVMDAGHAMGVVALESGARVITRFDLTPEELSAYESHPETFFGALDTNAARRTNSPMELYDFIHDSYKETSKEKLIEFLSSSHSANQLEELSQSALAELYSKAMWQSMMVQMKGKNNSI